MTTTTIKRQHLGKLATVVVSPGWISNGHWAVRRGLVANAPLFATEDTIKAAFPTVQQVRIMETDDNLDQILARAPADTLKAFTVTRWTYEGESGRRFALAVHQGEDVYLDRMYLDLLNVAAGRSLHGAGAGAHLVDDPDTPTFLIMPAVIDKTGQHLEVLRSLVHLQDLAADARKEVPA